jgi:hypothetical protein
VFALTLRGEAANTNIIVFSSTGPVVKLRSYHIYTPATTPPMWLTGPVVKLRSYHIYTPQQSLALSKPNIPSPN